MQYHRMRDGLPINRIKGDALTLAPYAQRYVL